MSRTVLITGRQGYLGRCVTAECERRGWHVVGLTRDPSKLSGARQFRLGDPVAAEQLAGADALIHCAYDFAPSRERDIWSVNVTGSERLLAAAAAAHVPRVVYISSISAFPGCTSLYGRAKLAIEQAARGDGAIVLRPGLVFGRPPGAMFGRLVKSVTSAPIVPLVGDGMQRQFLVHESDVSGVIARFAAAELLPPSEAVTVAHERAWTLREILETIGEAHGRKPRFLPVPWRAVWAGLRAAEVLHLPLGMRSDSVVSLMNQNPAPDFAPLKRLGVSCRPFAAGEVGPPGFEPGTYGL